MPIKEYRHNMECEKCGEEFQNKQAMWGHKATCDGAEWKTESTLWEMYIKQNMTINQIAQEVNSSPTNILYHMEKHGIDRRSISEAKGGNPEYQSKENLQKLYWENDKSTLEIARKYGVSRDTILYWMVKCGVPRRSRKNAASYNHAAFFTTKRGYEMVSSANSQVQIHRLVAIADGADPHKVFKTGMDTHHKNNVQWDNRPDNLEVLPHSKHQEITSGVYYGDDEYDNE